MEIYRTAFIPYTERPAFTFLLLFLYQYQYFVPFDCVCVARNYNETEIWCYFYFKNYENRNVVLSMNSPAICFSRT
jgi:hypothetical protein